MIGAKSFSIEAKDFIKGMSTSDYINDGGFSPLTTGINLSKTPGLLYAPAAGLDKSTGLTNTIIASCEDPTKTVSAYERLFVDSAGSYYSWNTITLVKLRTDATSPTRYFSGITDMIGFGGSGDVFTTNLDYIVKWRVDTAFNVTFYGFTKTDVQHPALVFENNAFYGDGNLLLRQTDPTVAPSVILTLDASQVIVALGIDPGTGRMLISTVDGVNNTDAKKRISRVLYYDGFSNKPLKSVITDEMVLAFYPVGGTLYITYGQNLGYWTGAGIEFLRALSVSLTIAQLPYKQHITNVGTTLLVSEGTKILAYGDIIKGQTPVPYYLFNNNQAGGELTMITSLGSGLLGYAFNPGGDPRFNTLDTNSVSSVGDADGWYTQRYTFDRPVTFNGVLIEYGAALPTDGSTVGVLRVIDSSQVSTAIKTVTNTQANMYTIESTYPSISTRSIQLRYVFNQQYPVHRFTVFYSPTE